MYIIWQNKELDVHFKCFDEEKVLKERWYFNKQNMSVSIIKHSYFGIVK